MRWLTRILKGLLVLLIILVAAVFFVFSFQPHVRAGLREGFPAPV
jgi:hypothetical protein